MNKKLTVVLFIAICFSVQAFSQITWNVKAGVSMNNMTSVDESKMKFGYNIGVGMDYQLTEMWSVQPSLMFTTKGFKIDKKEIEASYNPMYIQLPIVAAAKFKIDESMKFVVNAGPYLAYGIGGKGKYEQQGGNEVKFNLFKKTKKDGLEMDPELKKFDFGLSFGVGLELNSIIVGLNAEYGLSNVAKKESVIETSGEDGKKISPKNLGVGLSVGYKF